MKRKFEKVKSNRGLMRKTVMLIYRSNKLFLALSAGDAVDHMPRLKRKIFQSSKVLSKMDIP